MEASFVLCYFIESKRKWGTNIQASNLASSHPKKCLTALELGNSSIDVSEQHKIRWSPDIPAIKV